MEARACTGLSESRITRQENSAVQTMTAPGSLWQPCSSSPNTPGCWASPTAAPGSGHHLSQEHCSQGNSLQNKIPGTGLEEKPPILSEHQLTGREAERKGEELYLHTNAHKQNKPVTLFKLKRLDLVFIHFLEILWEWHKATQTWQFLSINPFPVSCSCTHEFTAPWWARRLLHPKNGGYLITKKHLQDYFCSS